MSSIIRRRFFPGSNFGSTLSNLMLGECFKKFNQFNDLLIFYSFLMT